MLVHQDFEKMPPKMFLMQILDNLSKSYIFLWERKDDANRLELTWKEISKSYNKNMFRTSLRKLNIEGLLSYEESLDGVSIELVGWDDINSDEVPFWQIDDK